MTDELVIRDIEILAQYSNFRRCVDIWIGGTAYALGERQGYYVSDVVWTKRSPAEKCETPIWLEDRAAQQLMDQLWACGFRPTEGKGSAGALAATERHLSDMQRIAFAQLGLEKSGD